ncbi:NAD(P)-binding protein [Hypomontagnella monticulosa]|nr:NAD(P)-binding protein [Hypomontagnella monticulosa]
MVFATPAVDSLLKKYPEFTLILVVRDASNGDRNTQKLRGIIAGYPGAKAHWTLISDSELTGDGYDKTLQLNHTSHVALVLRLLENFALDGGRIVMFSSEAHSPVITAWTHALNRYLEKDQSLNRVAVVAYNPGDLVDSRMFDAKFVSQGVVLLMRFAVRPLLPLRGYFEMLEKDESSPESRDEVKQQILWFKSLEWAQVTKSNTALQGAFE